MSKEFKEWFKVSELASLLDLSKVSIYNRIKQVDEADLQPLKKIEKGVTYYHFKILDILQPKEEHPEPEAAPDNKYVDDYIRSLQEQVEHLKEQISVKDEQIATRDRQMENMQVLLKDKQEVQLLDEPKEEKVGLIKKIIGLF